MTKVAILPVPTEKGEVFFRAVAGERQSHGKTAGEALDALTAQLPETEVSTLVIVQTLRPDGFFNADQQQRLTEFMARWRTARNQGQPLSAEQQSELERLLS